MEVGELLQRNKITIRETQVCYIIVPPNFEEKIYHTCVYLMNHNSILACLHDSPIYIYIAKVELLMARY